MSEQRSISKTFKLLRWCLSVVYVQKQGKMYVQSTRVLKAGHHSSQDLQVLSFRNQEVKPSSCAAFSFSFYNAYS